MSSSENKLGCLLPDVEIDNAVKFGFDAYSDVLASIVVDESLQTPFTIAIHGVWVWGLNFNPTSSYHALDPTTS